MQLKIKEEMYSNNCLKMQNDLHAIITWSMENDLHFNLKKCSFMTFIRSFTKISFNYVLAGNDLMKIIPPKVENL